VIASAASLALFLCSENRTLGDTDVRRGTLKKIIWSAYVGVAQPASISGSQQMDSNFHGSPGALQAHEKLLPKAGIPVNGYN
jgi:hypothetical protein